MVAADADALACDLAETYGILDPRALPVDRLAVLAVGLREDSRIKMRLAGARADLDTLLLAAAADRLSWLVWAKTKDAEKGVNRPTSILAAILGEGDNDAQGACMAYESAADYEAAWAAVTGVKHGD